MLSRCQEGLQHEHLSLVCLGYAKVCHFEPKQWHGGLHFFWRWRRGHGTKTQCPIDTQQTYAIKQHDLRSKEKPNIKGNTTRTIHLQKNNGAPINKKHCTD
jgi:hypothetical protein